MENKYYTWDDFVNEFGKEIVSAKDVYNNMKKSGLVDFSMIMFDYHFVSDSKEKLIKLNDFLRTKYPFKHEKYIKHEDGFELHGTTDSMPITKDNLLYWALDMAKRGYEFDCHLEGYGGAVDLEPKLPNFDKSQEDFYFNKAIDCYNSGNLSGEQLPTGQLFLRLTLKTLIRSIQELLLKMNFTLGNQHLRIMIRQLRLHLIS